MGNPNHDELGRFSDGDGAAALSRIKQAMGNGMTGDRTTDRAIASQTPAPNPGETYNAIAAMVATGSPQPLVEHANKFNIPNEKVQSSILQAYDNHRPSATSAYNRFVSARGHK